MKLKVLLLSLLAVFLLTFTVDAKANSPSLPDGYTFENPHGFSFDVAVVDNILLKDANIIKSVESFAPKLNSQLEIINTIAIAEKLSKTNHYRKILYVPLKTYITDRTTKFKQLSKKTDYSLLGYNKKS